MEPITFGFIIGFAVMLALNDWHLTIPGFLLFVLFYALFLGAGTAIRKYLDWRYWHKLGYRHCEVTCHHCGRKAKDFRIVKDYGLTDQCSSCTISRDPRLVYSKKYGGYVGVAGFPGEEYLTSPRNGKMIEKLDEE